MEDVELEAWRAAHPGAVVPNDFLELLRIANGIVLDLECGEEGFFSLLPLRRFRPVRKALFGEYADDVESNRYLRDDWPDARLAISTHVDGKWLVAIDIRDGTFFDADAYDSPTLIGRGVPGLLDWLDEHWITVLTN